MKGTDANLTIILPVEKNTCASGVNKLAVLPFIGFNIELARIAPWPGEFLQQRNAE
ncbi:hypothetical protein KOSB73_260373 [Klebsiella grimontii]|uniref:Uncharacterized protein n=1 Tax=Klebsiella grimontii TaxID=2058152 RepID=A0A285B3W0_9ENTR|nr:hypothetical protein KOSB73_260373 [Klebsiella grimontii]